MAHISVDWTIYIAIIAMSIMVIVLLVFILSRYISMEPCIQKQKEIINEIFRIYYEEIVIKKNSEVIKSFKLEPFCTKWIFSPCKEKGVCTKFKSEEIYCIKYFQIGDPRRSFLIKVCEKDEVCNALNKIYFNTKGIINTSKTNEITIKIIPSSIESMQSGDNIDNNEDLIEAGCI